VKSISFLLALLLAGLVHAENVTLRFDEVKLPDLIKIVFEQVDKRPYIITHEALESSRRITLNLPDVSPAKLVEQLPAILDASGLRMVRRAGVVIIEQRPPVVDDVFIYKPKHRTAKYLTEAYDRLFPGQPKDKESLVVAPKSETVVESDHVALTIPSDRVAHVRKLFEFLDVAPGEVLLKAAVYEVGKGRREASALQLALSISGIEASLAGTSGGNVSARLKVGGLDAFVHALDADSRFKSISRPNIRVRSGAAAKLSVGQDVPTLAANQLDRNGNQVQSIQYKSSGIILTAKPIVRDDEIELEVTQELSNFVQTTNGVNGSPTLVKRNVETRLTMKSGDVVILAGLVDDRTEGTDSRLPFLGWLFDRSETSTQSEILVVLEAVTI
jgi:hypothetical protein